MWLYVKLFCNHRTIKAIVDITRFRRLVTSFLHRGLARAAPDWVSLSIFRNVKPVVPLLTVCQHEFKVGGRTTEWGGVWEGTKANWWRLIAAWKRLEAERTGALVCYIRKYVIILGGILPLTSPQPKYWGMCPRHPRRCWRQCLLSHWIYAFLRNACHLIASMCN